MSAWSDISCDPVNPVFTAVPWNLPQAWVTFIQTVVSVFIIKELSLFIHYIQLHKQITTVWIAPVQLHALVMACFASLIAPFGGFFASGVKRAFNVKDFGHSIPGHGGMTDRMDCQFLMGFFSYMYYQSFIKVYIKNNSICFKN